LLPWKLGHGAKGKFQILHRIQRAGLVLGIPFVIAFLEGDGIDGTGAGQKLTPFVIGVEWYQGVVQIK